MSVPGLQGCIVSYYQGVREPGRGVDHPNLSSAEVKERIELYLYSTFGPSRTLLWWKLRFHWSNITNKLFPYPKL